MGEIKVRTFIRRRAPDVRRDGEIVHLVWWFCPIANRQQQRLNVGHKRYPELLGVKSA